jgi:hypothetical protein
VGGYHLVLPERQWWSLVHRRQPYCKQLSVAWCQVQQLGKSTEGATCSKSVPGCLLNGILHDCILCACGVMGLCVANCQQEGGVRVNAFVSGGFLKQVAPNRVGSKLEGFIHICDYCAYSATRAHHSCCLSRQSHGSLLTLELYTASCKHRYHPGRPRRRGPCRSPCGSCQTPTGRWSQHGSLAPRQG